MPADGVKGKTWGPSTVHQRERCHLPLHRPVYQPTFSKSAPNLPPPAPALQPRDLGNRAPIPMNLQIIQLQNHRIYKQEPIPQSSEFFSKAKYPKYYDDSVITADKHISNQNSYRYANIKYRNLSEGSIHSASVSDLDDHYDAVFFNNDKIEKRD